LWLYAYDYGELSQSASAKSPNPGQGYLALDGTTNGSAGINSAPNVDAGINGATHLLGGQRCGDHEDRGDSTNDRKLAEHNQIDVQGSCRDARVGVLDR
jgi:hypothetical protein